MARTRTRLDERSTADDSTPPIRETIRRFGAIHVAAGLLGLVGPAVWDNDDDGLVNTEPGLFLGVVAVNGPHAMLHVLWGLLGLRASRDESSARGHATLGTILFGALAAAGWQRFGFERGVHALAGLAVDGWGNLGHAVIAALDLRTLVRS